VQPGREPRDVGAELGGGVQAIGVIEQIGERSLAAALIRCEPAERPEVGVRVDGDRAQLEVAGEQVAHDERARGLPDTALRTDQRDGVRSRDTGLGTDPPLELGLVALTA
jgi:hypothetical protein